MLPTSAMVSTGMPRAVAGGAMVFMSDDGAAETSTAPAGPQLEAAPDGDATVAAASAGASGGAGASVAGGSEPGLLRSGSFPALHPTTTAVTRQSSSKKVAAARGRSRDSGSVLPPVSHPVALPCLCLCLCDSVTL
jgi:hypothetical protein